jgi:hypothetical protein
MLDNLTYNLLDTEQNKNYTTELQIILTQNL